MNHQSPLENFAQPALAAPAIWRLVASVGVVFGALLVLGLGGGAVGLAFGLDVSSLISSFETPISSLALLATFLIWRPALWLAMLLFSRRAYRTVFGPTNRANGREFLVGLLIAIALAVLSTGLAYIAVGAPVFSQVSLAPWIGFALAALPLIYIQSSAEELLFRGLILQHMAARFGAFWAWGLIPSILFGLLHWNPDGYGAAVWMVLAITGLTGLVFAVVTAATGNLGAAMGLHFGLNTYALLFIAPNKAFAGLALARWPEGETALNRLLVIDLGVMVVACLMSIAFYRLRIARV